MTEKWCGICERRHSYRTFDPAPHQAVARDFWLSLVTWGLILAAYVSAAFWLASR